MAMGGKEFEPVEIKAGGLMVVVAVKVHDKHLFTSVPVVVSEVALCRAEFQSDEIEAGVVAVKVHDKHSFTSAAVVAAVAGAEFVSIEIKTGSSVVVVAIKVRDRHSLA